MTQFNSLIPLDQIEIDPKVLLAIKRNDLVPILEDQYQLNHYADQLIQSQSVLLNGVDPKLNHQLSQIISQLIEKLAQSSKVLKKRKFNGLQKWLGIDIEYDHGQLHYLNELERLINEASFLSQRLQVEIQKSQARVQQVLGLREQMAKYIVAAQEFLIEYPAFIKQQHPLDNFAERLSKKINTLQTLQASNDIAITQMQLAQQLSFTLLDRFKEAQQVLIPAWQYHLKQSMQTYSVTELQKLDLSREKLMNTLKKSLEKNRAE
ncbi:MULTISPECIES: tellurium resistance protein [unclassified Acinetobacter]|uniref:tellurium resistance protein n=1 Tax=unclassified Acinetobacter TaxID=196816 RepID=UPI00190AA695|nr:MULTISPECIES: tellurium resistance protein [unclassified Acinetobacter]MBK0064878.1 tellurium resistance protein [Acinetobacter sp. S55]MBK0068379.1 tellurium resistance protein [Acinetobacter sp. S54]